MHCFDTNEILGTVSMVILTDEDWARLSSRSRGDISSVVSRPVAQCLIYKTVLTSSVAETDVNWNQIGRLVQVWPLTQFPFKSTVHTLHLTCKIELINHVVPHLASKGEVPKILEMIGEKKQKQPKQSKNLKAMSFSIKVDPLQLKVSEIKYI